MKTSTRNILRISTALFFVSLPFCASYHCNQPKMNSTKIQESSTGNAKFAQIPIFFNPSYTEDYKRISNHYLDLDKNEIDLLINIEKYKDSTVMKSFFDYSFKKLTEHCASLVEKIDSSVTPEKKMEPIVKLINIGVFLRNHKLPEAEMIKEINENRTLPSASEKVIKINDGITEILPSKLTDADINNSGEYLKEVFSLMKKLKYPESEKTIFETLKENCKHLLFVKDIDQYSKYANRFILTSPDERLVGLSVPISDTILMDPFNNEGDVLSGKNMKPAYWVIFKIVHEMTHQKNANKNMSWSNKYEEFSALKVEETVLKDMTHQQMFPKEALNNHQKKIQEQINKLKIK